jgi:hypothetical protein
MKMQMRANRLGITGFLAALLFVGMTGCGKETVDSAPPVASALAPAPGATNVAVSGSVTATFSEPMNTTTVSTSTFTLAGADGPVAGAVSYTATGSVATFTPSANLAYNTVYTATITTGAANTLGIDTAKNYTWTFTTMTPPPIVVSTVPASGATSVPVTQALTATFNEAMSPATIDTSTFTLTGPGGVITGAVTYNSSGFVATFTPGTNLAYSTVYRATITTGAEDLAGVGLVTSYSWTFTTLAPPLLVLSTVPVNAATGVPVTQALTATFNEPLNCTTLTSPETTFIVTGPGSTPSHIAGAVTCSGSVATFTPNSDLTYSTLYTATITTGAADTAGTALAANHVWSFITLPAPTPPTVISTVPANLATNIPINQAVLATFSEAMTAATIDAATFTLAGPGSSAVTGTVTYTASGSVATFTPAAPLAYNTLYTATITTGVTGLTGASLASNYVWTFTTAAAPIVLAPTVLSTIPANLAVNVPLNQIISATFSEPMSPPTINSTNFTLNVTGGANVVGIVAYASVGNTLTFTPAASLALSTQYTATITTGVTNLSGTALANAYSWTFTTGTGLDTTPPQLVSTSPANTAANVALNSAVSGTFNEAMNPLTISTSTFTLTGPTSVIGTVSYDALDFIATFTPNANLLPSTQYTATITSGVTDLAGNSLAAGGVSNPWIFTTGAAVVPPPVVLGPTVLLFGAFGGSAGVTNQGTETVVNGDIGTTGASTLLTGFYDESVPAIAGVYPCSYTVTPLNLGLVNGAIDTAAPPPTVGCPNEGTATTGALATEALLEAQTAYTTLQSLPPGTILSTNELGNRTLAPGTYTSASFYDITAGPLTLDAQGDPNATWVFQMGTYLTVGTPSATQSIILTGGAQAKNVFWQVGSAATINGAGGGTMVGTILAQAGVSVSTAGNAAITTIDGRIVSLTASVTIVNTVINVPAQ